MGSIESALPVSNGRVNESPLNRADEVADVSIITKRQKTHIPEFCLICGILTMLVAVKFRSGAHHPFYPPRG
jgi:hypothetical protein